MKSWFCDKDAKGACASCGRGLCADHAHFHDGISRRRVKVFQFTILREQ